MYEAGRRRRRRRTVIIAVTAVLAVPAGRGGGAPPPSRPPPRPPRPPRAATLAADGTVMSSPATIAQSGSLALLTGAVVRATAAQARHLGAPYKAGDQIGLGGIEQAFQRQLAGRPSLTIRIEGPGKRVDATGARFPVVPRTPVRTSIVMRDQLAASQAVRAAATNQPVHVLPLPPPPR